MPVSAAQVQWRLSGGAANSSPAASTGGAMSSTAAGANLFGAVTESQSLSGLTDYRWLYIANSADDPIVAPVLYLSGNTLSPSTTMAFAIATAALAPSGAGLASQPVSAASLSGLPAGAAVHSPDAGTSSLSWSEASAEGVGHPLPEVPSGGTLAVCLRRVVAIRALPSTDEWSLALVFDGASGRISANLAGIYEVAGVPYVVDTGRPRKSRRWVRTSRFR